MKYKTYRICLLSLVIFAVVGGIFYYQNAKEKRAQSVDGTFVMVPMAENFEEAFAWLTQEEPGGNHV